MKRMTKVLSFLVLVSIAVLAGRSFVSPDQAATACPQVKNYMNAGFSLDEVTPNAYRYIVAPTGTYAWGTVTLQLHGRTGGPYSLQTTYATVTCYVQAKEQGGTVKYTVTGTDVTENIVY